MKISVAAFVRLPITALSLLAGAASAQNYPERDITLINPFASGGGTEPITRQFVAQLSKILPDQLQPKAYAELVKYMDGGLLR